MANIHSLDVAITAALGILHRLVLEQWHTPHRLRTAKIAYAQQQIIELDDLFNGRFDSAAQERTQWQQRLASWKEQQP
jgi:hypothetical protein